MTDYVGNMSLVNQTFNAKTNKKLVILSAQMTVGAAGAVGATVVDDPAITFTKSAGTGDYAITFPKCSNGLVLTMITSVADTVNTANHKAFSATAGTYNLITQDASTAANPASGDIVKLLFFLEAE